MRVHRLLPIPLCVVAAGCIQCPEELTAAPGALEGRFCDPSSGGGLRAVEVILVTADGVPVEGRTATGDLSGNFKIENINPGAYTVRGILGPLTREKNVVIESDKVFEFVDEGCHEPPPPPPPTGGKVKGQLCDSELGRWVDFAQVWLSAPGDINNVQYFGGADVDGKFEIINVAPGQYDFHAAKNAYTLDQAAIAVMEAQETLIPGPATCEPPPGGIVTGRLCEEGVGWVEGARVYIPLPGGQVVETTTAPDGTFTITDVPPGPQVVRAEKDLFARSWSVAVQSGQTTTVPGPATCEPTPPPPETGTVTGRVCAPDGQTWLAGATVFVGDEANPTAQTTTDAEGRFTLTGVPAGQQTIHVRKNSFTATYTVTVTANGTAAIPEEQCQVIPTATRVAVVSGQYDNVRCVLTGQSDPLASRPGDACTIPGLGLDPANVTTVDGLGANWALGFLGDYARMSQYDIIFINCGVEDRQVTTSANATQFSANLRQYVEQGGSIYASDWAAPIIEKAFPEFVTWWNGTPQNDNVDNAKVGATQSITANVVDPGIRAALGQNTVALSFDLPYWVAMFGTAPAVKVYFRGNAEWSGPFGIGGGTMTNIPFTVGFTVGAGRVIFTSFHQERNITQDMQQVLNLLVFEL